MRKLIFLAAAALMFNAMNLQAQEAGYPKHELGVTVGVGANTEIIGVFGDLTKVIVSATVVALITDGSADSSYSYDDKHYLPTISAEYYYHPREWLGLGGFVSMNGSNQDMYVNWKDDEGVQHKEKTGVARRRNISIIPTVKFDWLRSQYVGMYSKVGVGVSLLCESQKDHIEDGTQYSDVTPLPNYQLSLLGLEAGSPRFRAYIELGTGEQGILLAGLKYRF